MQIVNYWAIIFARAPTFLLRSAQKSLHEMSRTTNFLIQDKIIYFLNLAHSIQDQ